MTNPCGNTTLTMQADALPPNPSNRALSFTLDFFSIDELEQRQQRLHEDRERYRDELPRLLGEWEHRVCIVNGLVAESKRLRGAGMYGIAPSVRGELSMARAAAEEARADVVACRTAILGLADLVKLYERTISKKMCETAFGWTHNDAQNLKCRLLPRRMRARNKEDQ